MSRGTNPAHSFARQVTPFNNVWIESCPVSASVRLYLAGCSVLCGNSDSAGNAHYAERQAGVSDPQEQLQSAAKRGRNMLKWLRVAFAARQRRKNGEKPMATKAKPTPPSIKTSNTQPKSDS